MMGSYFHNNGGSIRAFNIAMIIIPIFAVTIRFWSRALPRSSTSVRFWWDDWAVLVALPLNTAACALHISAVGVGFGEHVGTLSSSDITTLLKILWASYFMSDLSVALSKASVIFFYARVLTTRRRWFRYGLWLGHIVNALWWITSIARCLLFCNPVDKYWIIEKPGVCRSANALIIGSAVPSVVIDAYVLLLPLPIIAGLSMKLGRKILVISVFVCAYLVVAISLGRLITALAAGSLLNHDFTYYGVTFMMWVAAETSFSIIGCCLPVMFYLARYYIEKPFSLRDTKHTSGKRLFRIHQWPTIGKYSRQPSENSIELVQREFASPAAPAGYTVRATRDFVSDDDTGMEYDSLTPTIVVRKDVDIRSHGDF